MLRFAAFLGALITISAPAQTVSQLLATVSGTTQYREVALSPDGHYVAWTVTLKNPDNTQSTNSEIWLLDRTKSAAPTKLTVWKNPHAEHSIAWSPDSRQIAFLADAEKAGQLQLYLQSAARQGSAARRVTNLTGYLASPAWAPNASKIAVLFTENSARASGPRDPAAKDAGVVEEHIYEQRLTLIDPRSGDAKPITPPDSFVYEYDWAPKSDRFAYTAAQGNGNNNWWIARLYTIETASGEVAEIHKPALQIANPHCGLPTAIRSPSSPDS